MRLELPFLRQTVTNRRMTKGQKEENKMLKKGNDRRLKGFGNFMREEEGMGTVEIILIIVVLIGLVIIFKTQLRSLVEKVFEKITTDSNTVME